MDTSRRIYVHIYMPAVISFIQNQGVSLPYTTCNRCFRGFVIREHWFSILGIIPCNKSYITCTSNFICKRCSCKFSTLICSFRAGNDMAICSRRIIFCVDINSITFKTTRRFKIPLIIFICCSISETYWILCMVIIVISQSNC